MNPFSEAGGHQWDFMSLSELHWEMCQQGHICFSAADGGGWAAWPRSIASRTIINVPACDQQLLELAFLDRLLIDKANRWDCKARDNYVLAGFFKFVPSSEDERTSFNLQSAWSEPATGLWLMLMSPHLPTLPQLSELLSYWSCPWITHAVEICWRDSLHFSSCFKSSRSYNFLGSFFTLFLVEITFVHRLVTFFESLQFLDELFHEDSLLWLTVSLQEGLKSDFSCDHSKFPDAASFWLNLCQCQTLVNSGVGF